MSTPQGQELTCADCGREFSFTESEQRFFREKGFSPPKRCPDCRAKKKAIARWEGEGGATRPAKKGGKQ